MARRSLADLSAQFDVAIRAWEALAPETTFHGLSLEQFRSAARPARSVRTEIEGLRRRLRLAIHRRDAADERVMQLMLGVVESVKGTPGYGPDSVLYAAMGYVRKSARRRRGKKRSERGGVASKSLESGDASSPSAGADPVIKNIDSVPSY
jgi:hypothetical protein